MAQVGLWLNNEVGVGGVFTKQQLRAAVPAKEQADRRMRELREYGWKIDTNTDDASLRPEELRLVRVGDPVWSSTFRRKTSTRISAADRRVALIRAGYACGRCGIGLGQAFPESPDETGQLGVRSTRGTKEVTCQKCGAASESDSVFEEYTFEEMLERLSAEEKKTLADWIRRDRMPSDLERAWGVARRLGPDARRDLADRLS